MLKAARQLIPDRWTLRMSLRILYLFMIMSGKPGVGLNPLQFTTRMSMVRGEMLVLANRSSMAEKTTS
jgi:hypothetical protein